MATTLLLNGLALPASLIWGDRYSHADVAQQVTRTLGGRVVVEHQALSKGRPITLVSERQQGWVQYSVVQALQALADTPGGVYPLQIDTTIWSVIFRHHEAPAFSAEQLIKRLKPDPADKYLITLKLMTV